MLKSYVSDVVVRNILAVYAPFLYAAIQDSTKFFSRSNGHSLKTCVKLKNNEVEAWAECFDVSQRLMSETLWLPVSEAPEPLGFRVNLEEVTWMRLDRFDGDLDRLQYYLQTSVYFGGQGSARGQLYNAFLGLNLYVKDAEGRWLVHHIPGTGNASWNSPAFAPFCIADMSLWFNPSLDSRAANSMKLNYSLPHGTMFGAQIQNIDLLPSIEVLDDDRLRLFFWQLSQRHLPMPTEGKHTDQQGFVKAQVHGVVRVRQLPVSREAQRIAGQAAMVVSPVSKTGMVEVMPFSAFTQHGGVAVSMPFSDLVEL